MFSESICVKKHIQKTANQIQNFLYRIFTQENYKENEIEMEEIKIDSNGRIENWPKGFFDEWDIQLEKLLW